jgi:hypothetical protein
MSERRDDTTEPLEHDAPTTRERRPQNYYYDDGTNYEVYDPAEDVEGVEKEDEANGEDNPATGDCRLLDRGMIDHRQRKAVQALK